MDGLIEVIRSFVCSFVRSICSFVRSFVRSCVRSSSLFVCSRASVRSSSFTRRLLYGFGCGVDEFLCGAAVLCGDFGVGLLQFCVASLHCTCMCLLLHVSFDSRACDAVPAIGAVLDS